MKIMSSLFIYVFQWIIAIFPVFLELSDAEFYHSFCYQIKESDFMLVENENIQDTSLANSELPDTNVFDANLVTYYYVTAQQTLFKGKLIAAMDFIDSALNIYECADLFALKGTIYFKMDSISKAEILFMKAFELDSLLPIPPSPELQKWLIYNFHK